jgi:hypothetical protein
MSAIPFYYSERFCEMSLWVAQRLHEAAGGLQIHPVCVDDSVDILPPDVSAVPCIRLPSESGSDRIVVGEAILDELRLLSQEVAPVGENITLMPSSSYAMAYEHVTIPRSADEDRGGSVKGENFDHILDKIVAERKAGAC